MSTLGQLDQSVYSLLLRKLFIKLALYGSTAHAEWTAVLKIAISNHIQVSPQKMFT